MTLVYVSITFTLWCMLFNDFQCSAQSTAASVWTGQPHSEVDGSLLLPSAPELPIAQFKDSTVEE